MTYLFDGSYEGYLCTVFEAFERKEFHVVPTVEERLVPNIFDEPRRIHTDKTKAQRILQGLDKQLGKKNASLLYYNFLSDHPHFWHLGFRLIVRLFKTGFLNILDFSDPDILLLHQQVKKVNRERHRMKAFIRFVKSADKLYTALIEPDFNILPLILTFFKNRYADQDWLIYDVKRNYGYHFHHQDLQEVSLSEHQEIPDMYALELSLDPNELAFQQLWKTYFNSTTIKERKNSKLHLRHVPKRYWKYLPEKL